MQRMRLPVPDRDRTLHVHLPSGVETPAHGVQCTCHYVAMYVWRAAHEQRCTKVVVHNGPVHVHEFDTVTLFNRFVLRRLGRWPRVMTIRGMTPPHLATTGHRALGNTFEERRMIFPVSTAVSSAHAGSKGAA